MPNRVPTALVAVLSLVVASKIVLAVLSNNSSLPGLLWPALFAALSASALLGKRSAATALGYVYYAVGALSLLLPIVGMRQGLFGIITSVLWGVLALGAARYIFKNQAVRAFYEKQPGLPQAEG